MSRTWRCPECETINQDEKCVVCGYERVSNGQDARELPRCPQCGNSKSNLVRSEIRHSNCGVPFSENYYLCKKCNIRIDDRGRIVTKDQWDKISQNASEKSYKTGANKIAIVVAVSAAVFALGFTANLIINNKDNDEITIPAITTIPQIAEKVLVDEVTDSLSPISITSSDTSSDQTPIELFSVPDVVGLSRDEAIKTLENAGFAYEIISAESDSVEKDNIISQNIPSSASVPANYKIVLTVSNGKCWDLNVFYDEMLKAINDERKNIGNAPLILDVNLSDGCRKDMENKTYSKASYDKYWFNYFDYVQAYYEPSFDLKSLQTEKDSAETLLKFEADNYSSVWRESKYTHLGVHAEENEDGTFFVEWSVGYKKPTEIIAVPDVQPPVVDDVPTTKEYITIRGQDYPVNTNELWLGEGTTSEDIQELFLLKNLETLTIRPYDGGCVIFEYDGEIISSFSPIKSLHNLKNLKWIWTKVDSVDDLSSLTALERVDLHSNKISDISGFSKLNSITELEIYDNLITNISPLAALTNIETLDLCNNNIKDFSSLSDLRKLKTLSIGNYEVGLGAALSNSNTNQCADLTPLSGLTNLQSLNIRNLGVTDIDCLQNLTELTYLNASDNHLSDIPAVSYMSKMENLHLDGNEIYDFSPLYGLTNLKILSISCDDFNSFQSLSRLTSLEDLWIYNSADLEFSEEEKEWLKESLPDCDVHFITYYHFD